MKKFGRGSRRRKRNLQIPNKKAYTHKNAGQIQVCLRFSWKMIFRVSKIDTHKQRISVCVRFNRKEQFQMCNGQTVIPFFTIMSRSDKTMIQEHSNLKSDCTEQFGIDVEIGTIFMYNNCIR